MPQLISVVRNSDTLQAIICRRLSLLDSAALKEANDIPLLFEIDQSPLPLDPSLYLPHDVLWHRKLLEAWQALSYVMTPDAETLANVLIVLIETVSSGETDTTVVPQLGPFRPFLNRAENERPYRSTAAHPRAYRGTKIKPPKPKSAPGIDLRPFLCDDSERNRVLTQLAPFRSAAITLLEKQGYNAQALDRLPICGDIYLAYHHGQRDCSLPALFRTQLLPLLRGYSWTEVTAILASYWELNLDRRPELLAIVCRLLMLCRDTSNKEKTEEKKTEEKKTDKQNGSPSESIIALLRWISEQTQERQTAFATLLTETEGHRISPDRFSVEERLEVRALAADPAQRYRLYCLLKALGRGVSLSYMLNGFQLADRYHPAYDFSEIESDSYYPDSIIDGLLDHIKSSNDYYSDYGIFIWRRCGKMAGLGNIIERQDWQAYTPDVAQKFIQLLLWSPWPDSPEQRAQRCWTFEKNESYQIEKLLLDTPEIYRVKLLDCLEQSRWSWDDLEPLRDYLPFAKRLSRPPLTTEYRTGFILNYCVQYLNTTQRLTLLQMPDSSFLRLEEACRTRNNCDLIEEGCWSWLQQLPQFLLAGFLHHPAKLCKTARLLGCFNDDVREDILQAFESRMFESNVFENRADAPSDFTELPLDLPLEVLVARIQHFASDRTGVIPRPVRSYLDNQRTFDSEQLEHYRVLLQKRLVLLLLEYLEVVALDVLVKGFDIPEMNDTVRYALQMYRQMSENRTGFRKFLKAYLAGRHDYPRNHPRTQEWLRKHSGIDQNAWLNGIVLTGVLEAGRQITIRLEQNPLEKLKMGSYVGSCLGLGGGFTYSAAAVVLDANKQVLYAYDEQQRVIGRQLVAISEENELVCFEVYPINATDELKRMFAEYDTLFAEAIGVKVHIPDQNHEYTIARILSQDWWDDGAWNLNFKVRPDRSKKYSSVSN